MPVQPLAIPATVEPPPGTTVITRPRPEIDARPRAHQQSQPRRTAPRLTHMTL